MSIVAGFTCYDGLLLCSDTKYSGTTQTKDGPKLWLVHADEPAVVFGGASDHVGALHAAHEAVRGRLKPGMSKEEVVEAIDDALLKTSQRFPRAGHPQVQAIVGVRALGESGLYFNCPGDTSLSPAYHEYVCIGVEDLGNYFAAKLFNAGIPPTRPQRRRDGEQAVFAKPGRDEAIEDQGAATAPGGVAEIQELGSKRGADPTEPAPATHQLVRRAGPRVADRNRDLLQLRP